MSTVELVALIVAAVVGLTALDTLVRRPRFAAPLVLLTAVLEALIGVTALRTSVGGFAIGPDDVVSVLIATAAMFRFTRLRRVTGPQGALLALAGITVLSLVTGMATPPTGAAVNEFRPFLDYLAPALYFASVPLDPQLRRRIALAWLAAGIGLTGIVALRWAGRFGLVALGPLDARYDAAIRVLDGSETLFLASCALVVVLPVLDPRRATGRWWRAFGIVFTGVVLLLNRRTVWLAMTAAAGTVVLRRPDVGRRVVGLAAAGMAAVAIALAFFPGLVEGDAPLAQGLTDTGTLDWRVDGWLVLLEQGPETAPERAIGLPFGSGYGRTVDRQELSSSPHNFYLQTYLRTGALGLTALLVALGLSIVPLWRCAGDEPGPLSRADLLPLLTMQAVWFFAWSPGPDQGIVLGLAIAAAAAGGSAASHARGGASSQPAVTGAGT